MTDRRQQLIERGVVILEPASVHVDDAVDPGRIAPGVVIHPGCRIRGQATSIGPGSVLGEEGPVTLEDCQLGANVSLQGGFFRGATLLAGACFGSGAHVRPGTLLEEQSSCAHTVGLKQTVLMPYVVLGSLINFCDCLMAGGTDRRNHSEVGSSYVHFNFTAHRDKAAPSLLGDVPRGVMLDQPPIFLGGQGGLVGPVRIAYGTIIAAGCVYRHDVAEPGRLVFGRFDRAAAGIAYDTEIYGDFGRGLAHNLSYIGHLRALREWYRHARAPFLQRDPWSRACLEGALLRLEELVRERIARLGELAGKLEASVKAAERKHGGALPEHPYAVQRDFARRWPELADKLQTGAAKDDAPREREQLLTALASVPPGASYLDAVRQLPPAAKKAGTAWLQAIVASIAAL